MEETTETNKVVIDTAFWAFKTKFMAHGADKNISSVIEKFQSFPTEFGCVAWNISHVNIVKPSQFPNAFFEIWFSYKSIHSCFRYYSGIVFFKNWDLLYLSPFEQKTKGRQPVPFNVDVRNLLNLLGSNVGLFLGCNPIIPMGVYIFGHITYAVENINPLNIEKVEQSTINGKNVTVIEFKESTLNIALYDDNCFAMYTKSEKCLETVEKFVESVFCMK